MTSFNSSLSALVAVSSVVVLTACGGGGGGSDGGSVQASSTITSTNANDVAARSYSSSSALNNQISGGGSLVTGVSVETGKTGLTAAALQNLYQALKVEPSRLVVGVSGTEGPLACSGGGTMTVSYKVANVDTLTSGDTVSISSSDCVTDGLKTNGTMSVKFSTVTGTPSSYSAWSAKMAITFTNFAVTENNVTYTTVGDLALDYSQTSYSDQNFSGSGNSLQLSTTTNGATATQTLTNYTYTGSSNSAGQYTYRSDFTIAGDLPRLGNNVSYAVTTTKDFKQQGDANPSEGAMTVKATDGTSLTFTALDTTSVRLDLDKNGDGSVDETKQVSWSDLSGLL